MIAGASGTRQPADPWATRMRRWSRWRPVQVQGRCRMAAEEFVRLFPELRMVEGAASAMPHALWGTLEAADVAIHWWCVAPGGRIVDPTGHQFSRQKVYYAPLKPGMRWIRFQRCAQCRRPAVAGWAGECCTMPLREWLMAILEVPNA